jgi:Tol biopolymer transport system component
MRDRTAFAISPEGRRLAFAAVQGGQTVLYLRNLNEDTARPLKGTEGAGWPFWSPDGRSIGFAANNQLKRIDLDGELVQMLTGVGNFQGGTWGPDGQIIFTGHGGGGGLFRMPASGGEEPVAVSPARPDESRRMPLLLPDGKHFLFFAAAASPAMQGVTLGSLDSAEVTRLTDADASGSYVATSPTTGWVLFVRQGALVARHLDVTRRQLDDEVVTVADSVAVGLLNGAVSVSANGVIAYRRGASNPQQLTWFDRTGRQLGTLGEVDRTGQFNVELSPDGRRVAIHRGVPGAEGVWILDGVTGSPSRFDSVRFAASWPLWSPDSTRIAYFTENAIYQRGATASDAGGAERIAEGAGRVFTDWSRDGRWIMYMVEGAGTRQDLWVTSTVGERKPAAFSATRFNELWGRFSPDSRWVAYHSDESGTGRYEVYVRPFPGPGPAVRVSTAGGIHARWARAPDFKELYFVAPDGTLMAAPVTSRNASLTVGTPMELFPTKMAGNVLPGIRHQYDVARDGRFLVNVLIDPTPVPITLVYNWKAR